jgi:hypothetical protein
MSDAHTEFLQDPEAHASHVDDCAECRAIVERLDAPLSHEPIHIDRLPLAAWEGASYRSWGFVAACSAVLAAIALVLCHIAGVSPVRAIFADASINQWRLFLALSTGALRRATLGWQIFFGCAFVAVNTLLFVLLRRPTRGIDA